jgi:Ni,Fe-hydrogenase I large subunit
MKFSRQRIAHKIAIKYLSDVAEVIDPSTNFTESVSVKPEEIIMQKNKVLHHHFEGEGEADDFEKIPQFQDINYLVRYYVDNQGKKRKKDSF